MINKICLFCSTIILSVSLTQSTSAAEIWSGGDFQLGSTNESINSSTSPNTTNLWSENLWSNESNTNANQSTPPVSQNTPTNYELAFDVQPVTENGRMLVPVRGILEPLGATFDWNSKDGVVTAIKGSTVVKLKLNSKIALVNGREVILDTPAKVVLGRTLVPLRFISEAFGHKVNWDAATTKVTIDNTYYFYGDATKKQQDKAVNKDPVQNENSYVGNWEIWVPGGYATTGSSLNGDGSTTITQEYVQGAKGKTLSIKADGSYTWEVVGGTLKGQWNDADNGRIILLKGQMDSDWHVEMVDAKQIKIYAWGMTEYGTRIE